MNNLVNSNSNRRKLVSFIIVVVTEFVLPSKKRKSTFLQTSIYVSGLNNTVEVSVVSSLRIRDRTRRKNRTTE